MESARQPTQKVSHIFVSRSSRVVIEFLPLCLFVIVNPLATGDLAEKHVLKLVEGFFGHCRAV